ncbi:MAG: Gfo/Idh/MocA family oxidoreductase [Planctomycetes bacterium]|nr:Gfo/Idh/MocA family oxidoreductase [Planctomycetota bacterium]
MTRARVGIVGARRRRQGLGPYMARFFDRQGAEIVAVLGTSADSARAATRELAEAGMSPRPFADPETFFRDGDLEAVVIASPHETHLAVLELAASHGVAAFCEKPFVWGGPDPIADAERVVEEFARRDLLLLENVQWSYTLPAFCELHPGVWEPGRSVRTLEFLLGPAARDVGRITDSLSHVLSVLQTLGGVPDGALQEVRFESLDADRLVLGFRYPGQRGPIETTVTLKHAPHPPRPAGYGIDGHFALRKIEPTSYAITFERADTGRSVPVADPMEALIHDFLAALRTGDAPRWATVTASHIVPRLRHLVELRDAYLEASRSD